MLYRALLFYLRQVCAQAFQDACLSMIASLEDDQVIVFI